MNKYSIAKQLIEQAATRGKEAGIDEHEVIEALIVLSIQNLVDSHGGPNTKQFVQYQLDSMATDVMQEIQRPGFG